MAWVDSYNTVHACEIYVRQALARWLIREDFTVGMWDCSTDRYIGGIWCSQIDWRIPAKEIGYWICASAQGQGYVTEVVTLLCKLAFMTLAAQRVSNRCDAANTRSTNIPCRLGFVHEATLRNDSRNTMGELTDTLVFALARDDYDRLLWSQT